MEATSINTEQKNNGLAAKYGARYYAAGETAMDGNRDGDYYSFEVFIGPANIKIEKGDSLIGISDDRTSAMWVPSMERDTLSEHMAVLFRGYSCGYKMAEVTQHTNLPYVNGCATRQIFAPERTGDPTLQLLTIPPNTSEQVHHIHPTARVVYVLSGRGWSEVGQSGSVEITELTPGMVCVLDPMCPHHFNTDDEHLTVLPVHVFSSGPGNIDKNHPMFNGTKEV